MGSWQKNIHGWGSVHGETKSVHGKTKVTYGKTKQFTTRQKQRPQTCIETQLKEY